MRHGFSATSFTLGLIALLGAASFWADPPQGTWFLVLGGGILVILGLGLCLQILTRSVDNSTETQSHGDTTDNPEAGVRINS